ncbi:MAG: hypothetical protein ACK5UO_10200 [Microcystis sp.]|uniref:hypothetical protein n=1 Tax=Microcystis sp. TaxID=1127 RepID=UPI003918EF5E
MTTFQLTKRDRLSLSPKSDRPWRSYPKQWQFQSLIKKITAIALLSMCMVRSPKSIAGAVGLALGNAPYGDSDRTTAADAASERRGVGQRSAQLDRRRVAPCPEQCKCRRCCIRSRGSPRRAGYPTHRTPAPTAEGGNAPTRLAQVPERGGSLAELQLQEEDVSR